VSHRHHGSATAPTSVVIAATATAKEPAPVLPTDIMQTLPVAGLMSTLATAYVVTAGASQRLAISLTRTAQRTGRLRPTCFSTLNPIAAAVQQAGAK
jgi:hypothetical protein